MRRSILALLVAGLFIGALYIASEARAGPHNGNRGGSAHAGSSRGGSAHIGRSGGARFSGMRSGGRHFSTHRSGVRSGSMRMGGRHLYSRRGGLRTHHVSRHSVTSHRQSLRRQGMHTAGKNARHHLTRSATMHRNGFFNRKFGASNAANRFRHGSGDRHHHGFFWAGAMFWPYAYGDIFSYALWPYDDEDSAFWDYGPDLMVGSAFWPYGELAYGTDGYDVLPYANYDVYSGSRRSSRAAVRQQRTMANACDGLAPGITGLPLDRIAKIVTPDEKQRAALDDLRTESAKAEAIMKQ